MVSCSELECEIDTGLLVLLNARRGKCNLETTHGKPFNQSFTHFGSRKHSITAGCSSKPMLLLLTELGLYS